MGRVWEGRGDPSPEGGPRPSQSSSASPHDFLGGREQELVELGIGLFGSLTALGGDGGEVVHGVAGAEIERIEILVPPCSVGQGESKIEQCLCRGMGKGGQKEGRGIAEEFLKLRQIAGYAAAEHDVGALSAAGRRDFPHDRLVHGGRQGGTGGAQKILSVHKAAPGVCDHADARFAGGKEEAEGHGGRDGTYVWADKTSLGGDDCIAVATALAILADDSLPHPPLEVVFTIDEETGMDGAAALDCSDLKGRLLLNLDSEEEGVFTVACAGGLRADCFLPAARQALGGESCFSVSLSGLQGGHSGAEIDKGRGNAVQLMGRALYGAMEQVGALRIADLRGGQFDNVICPRCDAVVAVPAGKEEEFTSFVRKFDRIMKNELSVADGGVTLSCAAVSGTAAYDADASARMLHALLVMPQGVQVMSPDFPGLVQTSQNLGVITAEDDGLRFSLSIRSSVASEKEMLLQKVRAIVTFAGGTVSTRGDYPAWQYARQSPLRDTVMAAYKRVTGKDGVALAIHAGLECGLLAGKMPGLDAVSFGPELLDIHSPRERLGVASVERMYQLVCEILKNCR